MVGWVDGGPRVGHEGLRAHGKRHGPMATSLYNLSATFLIIYNQIQGVTQHVHQSDHNVDDGMAADPLRSVDLLIR